MAPAILPLTAPKNSNIDRTKLYFSSMGLSLEQPQFSLSRYFPRGTEYFYSYPTGEDSQFFNNVPPAQEELVAARSLVCAGDHVRPIVFASSMQNPLVQSLKKEMGMSTTQPEQVILIPPNITHNIVDNERNTLIKQALNRLSQTGKLIMAQPFLDAELHGKYLIRPELTIWLNDKKNLSEYVPHAFLPERYAHYPNGRAFALCTQKIPTPCVVKVSSSSSGNGVRICLSASQLEHVKGEYAGVSGDIIIEKMINVARNFGVQFGIPSEQAMQEEIIGVSEQLTTPEGEFIGGIISPRSMSLELESIKTLLLHTILPSIRKMGWFGIGGFDILVDAQGKAYITDPNFRMTGMTPYLCKVRNGNIRMPMMSFSAMYRGSEESFRRQIMPLAQIGSGNEIIHTIALTKHNDVFRINAAMLFEETTTTSLQRNARLLMELGMESKALHTLGAK